MQVIDHIEIRDGQGIIRRHNLKAKLIARMHLWEHQPAEAVMRHYELTPAEFHAAIAFYYDNQAELDAEYAEQWAQIRAAGRSTAEFLRTRNQGER